MNQDRELLELAALAYGLTVGLKEGEWFYCEHGPAGAAMYRAGYPHSSFSPRTDDGDALRLANKLRINIERMRTLAGKDFGINCWPVGRGDCGAMEDRDLTDYNAATRLAITRAAAAIGKAMQESEKQG